MPILVALGLQAVCVVWVWTDSKKRDWDGDGFANRPWKWALGVTFLWILAFPMYLLRRNKRPLLA